MAVMKQELPSIKLHMNDTQQAEKLEDALLHAVDSGASSPQSTERAVPSSLRRVPNIQLPDGHDYTNLRNRNRPKVEWSEDEVDALLQGVERHGQGNWSVILSEAAGVFHAERRVIDLVNKYKQYLKASSFYTAMKRVWLYVDEDGEPKMSCLNEPITYSEKFPYTAATKIAKRLKLDEGQTTEIIIRSAEDCDSVHYYRVSLCNERLRVKKIVPTH